MPSLIQRYSPLARSERRTRARRLIVSLLLSAGVFLLLQMTVAMSLLIMVLSLAWVLMRRPQSAPFAARAGMTGVFVSSEGSRAQGVCTLTSERGRLYCDACLLEPTAISAVSHGLESFHVQTEPRAVKIVGVYPRWVLVEPIRSD